MSTDTLFPSSSHYELHQYEVSYPVGIEQHYWHLARNRILLRHLKRNRFTQFSILDVGCGPGVMVEWLRNKGIDCYGCEPANSPVPDCRKSYIFSSTGVFDLDKDFRKKISVILCLDVLEHISKPQEFLNQLISEFPNLKGILLTVPARKELWSNYDEFFGHFQRYEKKSLKTVIPLPQVSQSTLGYFFHLLYPVAFAQKLIFGKRPVVIERIRFPLFHKIVGAILYWECILLPKSLPGTSLWACLKVTAKTMPY